MRYKLYTTHFFSQCVKIFYFQSSHQLDELHDNEKFASEKTWWVFPGWWSMWCVKHHIVWRERTSQKNGESIPGWQLFQLIGKQHSSHCQWRVINLPKVHNFLLNTHLHPVNIWQTNLLGKVTGAFTALCAWNL